MVLMKNEKRVPQAMSLADLLTVHLSMDLAAEVIFYLDITLDQPLVGSHSSLIDRWLKHSTISHVVLAASDEDKIYCGYRDYQAWRINGKLHSARDEPCVVDWFGSRFWCANDTYHRDGAPAVVHENGTEIWYQHGLLYDPRAKAGP